VLTIAINTYILDNVIITMLKYLYIKKNDDNEERRGKIKNKIASK